MTAPTPRASLALVTLTLVLAGAVAPVGAETATVPAQQQPPATELDLRASVTGDIVVVAGWFELTGAAEGHVDTGTRASDFGATYDVNFAETVGEFAYSGKVVGTVNAGRVLFTFGGNASGFGRGESAVPPAPPSEPGDTADASPAVGPAGTSAAVVLGSEGGEVIGWTPVQLRPFRSLGISVFDVYWQLATLLLGLIVVGALPRFSRRVADLGVDDPLRTGGAGLAVVLVAPLALLLLGLSLFGIPLAIAGTAIYLVVWWLGAVYGRFAIGLWLLGALSRTLAAVDVEVRRIENRWIGLLVGTLAVGLLAVLPIVGPIVDSAVLLLGLGGISRLAYGAYLRTERTKRYPDPGAPPASGDE